MVAILFVLIAREGTLRGAANIETMAVSVTHFPDGSLNLGQSLVHPVVYLDHWAVRLFAEDGALQARLLLALKKVGGTLLISQHNFSEFSLMTDMDQASRVERFFEAALPNVYLADFALDRDFAFKGGAPHDPEHPGQHWLFKEFAKLTARNGGQPTLKGMITDVIVHREDLAPVFEDMKSGIADAVQRVQQDPKQIELARTFRAAPGMTLIDVLGSELLREPQLGNPENFGPNDAMDWLHATSAVAVGDYVLLDGKWCDKVARASSRMKRAGLRHPLAKCYSKRGNGVGAFLSDLDSALPS